jgi:hypothetical protein
MGGSKHTMNVMLDMQIRHQSVTPSMPITVARSIERHDPHYGAREKHDDINLDAHGSKLHGECGESVAYGRHKSEAAGVCPLAAGSPTDEFIR